jgi:hypothetical protein
MMTSFVVLWLLASASTAQSDLEAANATAHMYGSVLTEALSFKPHTDAKRHITLSMEQEDQLEISVRLGYEADGTSYIEAVSACSSPIEAQMRELWSKLPDKSAAAIAKRISIWRMPPGAVSKKRLGQLLRIAGGLRPSIFPLDALQAPMAHYKLAVAGDLGGINTFDMWVPISIDRRTGRESAGLNSALLQWCDKVIHEVEIVRQRQGCGASTR